MKDLKRIHLSAVAVLLIIAGCSSAPQITKTTPLQSLGAPDWVVKGSGAFTGDKGKVFYGIGSASNIQNTSLLRSSSENRARNEVAKIFQVYTASLMKDYMASTSAGQANVSSEEQHVEQAIKTVTATTLSGVEIIDHWQHPATGELYSLARLDLEKFKENLEKAKELNSQARDYIRKNADRLHNELEKEEEKMNQR